MHFMHPSFIPLPDIIPKQVFKTTDVGDFFPENYHDELESIIPRCSQNVVVQEVNKVPLASLTKSDPDPALPGMLSIRLLCASILLVMCTFSLIGPFLFLLHHSLNVTGMEYMTDEYWENDVVNHFVGSGIAECNPYTEQCIPADMQFVPSSIPDGEVYMQVSRISSGKCR
jgi:hypothetical protein